MRVGDRIASQKRVDVSARHPDVFAIEFTPSICRIDVLAYIYQYYGHIGHNDMYRP